MPIMRWLFTFCLGCAVVTSLAADEPRSWESVQAVIAPVLENVPATGLLVFDILPGSQAAKAGLRLGDIITHYDGQPVSNHQELMNLAKVANNDKRSEILVVARRGHETIELTFSTGPMGIRLEDVVEGEKRTLSQRVGMLGNKPNVEFVRRLIAENVHQWQLVFSEAYSEKPSGWTHLYLTQRAGDGPVLRIQQQLAVGERVVRQDIVVAFQLDSLLSLRSLQLAIDDKPVLDLEHNKESGVGHRLGVPVQVPMARDLISSYLAPYIAAGMKWGGTQRMDVSVLLPASLEGAPLGEFEQDQKSGDVVLRVLGREEMRISFDERGDIGPIKLRGGLRLQPSTRGAGLHIFCRVRKGVHSDRVIAQTIRHSRVSKRIKP